MWAVGASFLLCLVFIPLLEGLAPKAGLMDQPTERKQHIGDVPTVGGIAVFAGLLVASIMLGTQSAPPVLLVLSFIILAVGCVDDMRSLSARFRLLAQIGVSLTLVLLSDVRIESVGSIFGTEAVQFDGSMSIAFTVVCIVGVINAINMIDGLDGLSGSILLLSFSALALLANDAGSFQQASFLACTAACLLAFLCYNNRVFRPKARIFLGDAGSMMLGLMLVWYFVEFSQSSTPVMTAVSAGWILGLPLVETVSVMVGRIIDKRSPFDAGRDHMHHRLRRAGFSVNASVLVMVSMHALLVLIGLVFATNTRSDVPLFWCFVVITIAHFYISRYLLESYGAKVVDAINRRRVVANGT